MLSCINLATGMGERGKCAGGTQRVCEIGDLEAHLGIEHRDVLGCPWHVALALQQTAVVAQLLGHAAVDGGRQLLGVSEQGQHGEVKPALMGRGREERVSGGR